MPKKVKVEPVIVGGVGHKSIYLIFAKNDTPIKGELWRLQHPGNELVDQWEESIVSHDEGGVSVSREVLTKKFFSECVFPVNEPFGDLEGSLVKKYGANPIQKRDLNINEMHPGIYGVWQKVQKRFFDGDIFFDVPDMEELSEVGSNSGEG